MIIINHFYQKHFALFQVFILLFSGFLLSTSQASAKMKSVKYRSPLKVEIKLPKESYQVREPIDGQIIIENTYPASLPAVFTIKLFFNDKLFSEQTTAIKKVPMGTIEFTFKGFGIPAFNDKVEAEGEWRIHIVQLNMDESYAVEAKILIVPPAVSKEENKRIKIKKLF